MLDSQTLNDLPFVRKIRQLIRKWWRLEIAFADTRGYVTDHARGVITPPDNVFCKASLSSEAGLLRCNLSVEQATEALQDGSETGARIVMPCHLGFPVAMAPVLCEGEFRGTIFTGGFLIEGHETDGVLAAQTGARELGLDVGSVRKAGAAIPRMTARELECLGDLMEAVAEEVASVIEYHENPRRFGDLIGTSPLMERLYMMLEKVAQSDSTVLIIGENGTGKEVVARALHTMGPRRNQAFVATNCSALNDNLLETELFGHVKGAFTGAIREKDGLFMAAHEGTLFLDEIGDTSPAMQVKLLRVLQEGTFMPVGAVKPVSVDVRVVAATNRPLQKMVAEGTFREDLYYRLNVIGLEIPPLRDRKSDLPLLCDHFLSELTLKKGTCRKTLSTAVMQAFWEYDWPGNVRQLENELERLVVLTGNEAEVGTDMLSPALRKVAAQAGPAPQSTATTLREAVRAVEARVIRVGLERTGGNKLRLARELGVSRTTLIKKVRELGLEEPQPDEG